MCIIVGTEVVQNSASPLEPWLEARHLDGQASSKTGCSSERHIQEPEPQYGLAGIPVNARSGSVRKLMWKTR